MTDSAAPTAPTVPAVDATLAAPIEAAEVRAWRDMYATLRSSTRCSATETRGVERFVADVEAPSPARDTPAYADWARAGLVVAYARTLSG